MKKKTVMDRRLALICGAFAAAALVLALVGGTVAKYITTRQEPELLTAKRYWFESDYLTEAKPTYEVYGDSVTFHLTNSDGLNVSEVDVKYDITVSGSGNLTGGTGGTLTGGVVKEDTYTLTGSGEVTVTAQSTDPYAKTLTATFVFQAQNGWYTVTNGQRYVQIDVYTTDAVSSITVTGTTGLTPDKTNNLLGENGNIGALEADSHYTFVYFKSADKTYQTVEKTAIPADNTISLEVSNG